MRRAKPAAGHGQLLADCHQAVGQDERIIELPVAGLAELWVEVGEKGVKVDRFLHTTGERVWACGDVTGAYQFSHMAEFEAKLLEAGV